MSDARADRPDNIPAALRFRAEHDPGRIATRHRDVSGAWVPTTWAELRESVSRLAATFRARGVGKGDRVAIFARTSREWQLSELAALTVGAAVVGIEPHLPPAQAQWVLEHSEATALVVDRVEATEGLALDQARGVPLKLLLAFGAAGAAAARRDVMTWNDAMAADPDETFPDPDADAPATLIYTSGTTGAPKGIEYTHRQLLIGCRAILEEFDDLTGGERTICWLPMAFLFQRMMNLVACALGAETYFVDDPREITDHLREVQPTIFVGVPRFYEKLYQGIQLSLAQQPRWKRRVVNAALRAGASHAQARRSGRVAAWPARARHAVFDRLVLRSLRAPVCGRVRWMISGSAPMPVWLLEFFEAIGLLVLEAYGLSENTVPVAVNRPRAYRFGTVGRPMRANDVRFADDGEVLVNGPGLFSGYFREGRPDDRFTPDGYYRTGDCGVVDTDGFVSLVGRKSEIIKTSTGRRVGPAGIEAVYRQSTYFDHVIVVGNNRPHLAGLITLNVSAVELALRQRGARVSGSDKLAAMPFVQELVQGELDRCGAALSAHDRIRAFRILDKPLTMAEGELTPTLKFRRDQIDHRYRALIDELYRHRT